MLRDSALIDACAFYVVVGKIGWCLQQTVKEILAEQGVDMEKPVIVLNHTPDYLEEGWKQVQTSLSTGILIMVRLSRAISTELIFGGTGIRKGRYPRVRHFRDRVGRTNTGLAFVSR